MIQTILNIALAASVAVLAWKLWKVENKRNEAEIDYHKLREVLDDPEVVRTFEIIHLLDLNMYAVGLRIWHDGRTTSVVLKTVAYNPSDASDRDYALNCAHELKEAIEYDWRIKEVTMQENIEKVKRLLANPPKKRKDCKYYHCGKCYLMCQIHGYGESFNSRKHGWKWRCYDYKLGRPCESYISRNFNLTDK